MTLIAISGYGKMGREIEQICLEDGINYLRVDPNAKECEYSSLEDCFAQAKPTACIDFTVPESAFRNTQICIEAGVPVAVGTTGWYGSLPEVRELLGRHPEAAFLYAANFSVGVNLFWRIAEQSAKLFSAFDTYDLAAFESHHRAKLDSPSGTAQVLAERLLQASNKKDISYDRAEGGISKDTLHVASLRIGSERGSHSVIFDSEEDSVELSHRARSRVGFARGAVGAALWLEEREGFFSIDDFLNDRLSAIAGE